MAQVATVYTIKQWPRELADVLHGVHDKCDKEKRRPRPTNKRVWASVVHSPQRVIDDAFAEAVRRDPDLKRRWVVRSTATRTSSVGSGVLRARSASRSRSCSTWCA